MSPPVCLWATLTSRVESDPSEGLRLAYNNRVTRMRKKEYPMLRGTLPVGGILVLVLTKQ
jgi:hypothetical protein